MFPRFLECRSIKVEMKMYKNVISVDIRVNGEKLDKVGSFKYLGAVATVKSGFQA